MNRLSIVCSGLFRETRDSSVSRLAVGGRRGCDSLQYPNQHLHNAFRAGRERKSRRRGGRRRHGGQRGGQKDGRTTFVAIRKKSKRYSDKKKRTNWQKGIVSAFLLSLLHLLRSVLLQIYSRCPPTTTTTSSPPPLCLPAPGNHRLAEIFLFK